MNVELTHDPLRQELLRRVADLSGQNVLACYQCGKCSAGCPAAEAMDLLPNQVMRLVQLGLVEFINEKRVSKPMKGHFAKAGVPPVKLLPTERWLFLADRTYDLPHEHAEGPCGVLFGDPLPAVQCDNGSYVVQVDGEYPMGTRSFRLVVWDFHGLKNTEGLAALRAVADQGNLP